MKLTPSYRRKIATLLLLLYTFIATPVQLWHHHPAAFPEPGSKQEHKGSNSLHKAGHGHCTICDHQYAAYDNDAFVSTPVRHIFFSLLLFTAPVTDTQQAVLSCSNKGPPAA